MGELIRKHVRHGAVEDTFSALFFTAVIVAISFFVFRLRVIKNNAVETPDRPGSQLLSITQLPETERASAFRWYMLQDPTIPARGNAGVGFAVVPETTPMMVPLAPLSAAVELPETIPPMPELPALDALPEIRTTALADFPLPAPDKTDAVILRQSDGLSLPAAGLFQEIPSGRALRPTVIRIIPVGGGLSRLVLTESCGDAALDSYARQELAKLKFETGNVITVCWSLSRRAK